MTETIETVGTEQEYTPAFPILYEDNHIIVVLKPQMVACCPDESRDNNLLDMVKEYIKIRYNKPGNVYVGLVHRLDRPTGGVMVYAKTKSAAAALSAAIANGEMEKEYLAMVTGTPAPVGEMRDLLYHDPRRNKSFVVTRARHGVREAILTYEVIRTVGDRSLVKVRLETGRTHQIRVQFASRGYPLIGDARYGGGKGEMHLFSHRITVRHPKTGEPVTVESRPEWGDDAGAF